MECWRMKVGRRLLPERMRQRGAFFISGLFFCGVEVME
jgi:hypothetical protein